MEKGCMKETHNHLLEGKEGCCLLVATLAETIEFVVVPAQVVLGNVRFP